VQNFTRVETFGDHQENDNNDVQWLRVDVDPRSREVFSFQPQIIPAKCRVVAARRGREAGLRQLPAPAAAGSRRRGASGGASG
jgi:hypothetical protein